MEASEQSEELAGRCKEWKAQQPVGGGKIMVRGWCTFPGSGWSMELVRRDSDDPAELVLERVVAFDPGRQAATVKAIEAEYVEETETEYDRVTILPDGSTIEVQKGT
jgi:dienelactone hydrolase